MRYKIKIIFTSSTIGTLHYLCDVEKCGYKNMVRGKSLQEFLVPVAILHHPGLRIHLSKYEYVIYQIF